MVEPANDVSLPAAGWRDLFSGKNAIYSCALVGGVALHALNIYIVTTGMPSAISMCVRVR
jgi:hypothetical protein